MKFLVAALIISQAIANQEEDDYAKAIIEKTESQYRSIKDYQVKMTISMKIPAFRMPKKKYTVFFKQPDKLEIKVEDLVFCRARECLHLLVKILIT